MELSSLLNSQYGFHAAIVGGVILCVVLVFMLGFKTPPEPEFEKLSEDRKSGAKKKKLKDKKSSANGHVTAVTERRQESAKSSSKKDVEKSPSKKQSQEKKSPKVDKESLKENRDNNGNKKSEKNLNQSKNKESGKGNKENVLSIKNKKNIDLDQDDDGEWEQAVSRRDKRSKKSVLEEILPQKSEKKKGKKKSDDDENVDMQQPDSKILDVLNEIGLDAEAAVSVEEKPTVVAKETKKSSKKKKPPAPAIPEPAKIEPKVAAPTPEPKVLEPVVEVKPVPEVVEQPKQTEPKNQRQKKQADKSPLSGGDSVAIVKEEPVKQEVKKEVSAPPTPASAPSPPAAESNVVFDELGDSWKEAKAPKKSSRKKTRVD